MDAFGNSATFSRVFNNLLESYAPDAFDRFEKETDTGDGAKAALEMLAVAAAATAEFRSSGSLGRDLRLESQNLVGFALAHEGHVIPLCLFMNTGNRKYTKSAIF